MDKFNISILRQQEADAKKALDDALHAASECHKVGSRAANIAGKSFVAEKEPFKEYSKAANAYTNALENALILHKAWEAAREKVWNEEAKEQKSINQT